MVVQRVVMSVTQAESWTVLANQTDDLVIFDVPPPDDGVRGSDAYGETFPPFFEWQRPGASFEIVSLDVTAGDDVDFAWALLHCGTPDEFERDPAYRLLLTVGLRQQDGGWMVTHDYHSFPDKS